MSALLPARIERAPRPRWTERAGVTALRTVPISSWIGAAVLIAIILTAVFAPWLAPYDPNEQNLVNRLQGPSLQHWVGTDELGRDVLSRLIFGAQISMLAVCEVLLIASVLGLPLGMLAGYYGKWLDSALSRVMDVAMSIPGLVFALTVVAIFGPSLFNAMFAVGVNVTPRFFRVARAATLDVRGRAYIEGGIALGTRPWRMYTQYVLPNVMPPILVVMTVSASSAVTAEASLSFLGLGVRPPTPSWGSMLSAAASTIAVAPMLIWAPGVLILLLVLAFTATGEGVRVLLANETDGGGRR